MDFNLNLTFHVTVILKLYTFCMREALYQEQVESVSQSVSQTVSQWLSIVDPARTPRLVNMRSAHNLQTFAQLSPLLLSMQWGRSGHRRRRAGRGGAQCAGGAEAATCGAGSVRSGPLHCTGLQSPQSSPWVVQDCPAKKRGKYLNPWIHPHQCQAIKLNQVN